MVEQMGSVKPGFREDMFSGRFGDSYSTVTTKQSTQQSLVELLIQSYALHANMKTALRCKGHYFVIILHRMLTRNSLAL